MPTIGAGVAGGGISGFLMGFAVKKVANLLKLLILTLVGIQLFLLAMLESQGLISVDWTSINSALSTVASEGVGALVIAGGTAAPIARELVTFLPATGGAVAGFFVGWRRG